MKFLPAYAAYQDSKLFLDYLEANGSTKVNEASSEAPAESPVNERLGGFARGIREFHGNRAHSYSIDEHQYKHTLSLDSFEYISAGKDLVIPPTTAWVGIIYLDTLGEEYQGLPDIFGDLEISPEAGDVMVFPADVEKFFGGAARKFAMYWKAD